MAAVTFSTLGVSFTAGGFDHVLKAAAPASGDESDFQRNCRAVTALAHSIRFQHSSNNAEENMQFADPNVGACITNDGKDGHNARYHDDKPEGAYKLVTKDNFSCPILHVKTHSSKNWFSGCGTIGDFVDKTHASNAKWPKGIQTVAALNSQYYSRIYDPIQSCLKNIPSFPNAVLGKSCRDYEPVITISGQQVSSIHDLIFEFFSGISAIAAIQFECRFVVALAPSAAPLPMSLLFQPMDAGFFDKDKLNGYTPSKSPYTYVRSHIHHSMTLSPPSVTTRILTEIPYTPNASNTSASPSKQPLPATVIPEESLVITPHHLDTSASASTQLWTLREDFGSKIANSDMDSWRAKPYKMSLRGLGNLVTGNSDLAIEWSVIHIDANAVSTETGLTTFAKKLGAFISSIQNSVK